MTSTRQNPSTRLLVEEIHGTVAQMTRDAKASAASAAKHNKRRAWDKKYRKRKRLEAKRKKTAPLLTTLIDSDSEVVKNRGGDLFANLAPPRDDWPNDFASQFWDTWPRNERKYDEAAVGRKLARIRQGGRWTWAQVFGGLQGYLATNPEPKWIPSPLKWLGQMRWQADYSKVGTGRKLTFGDFMRGGVARHG